MNLPLIPFTTLLVFLVFDQFIHISLNGLNKMGLLEKILMEILVMIVTIFTVHKFTTTNLLIVLNFIVIYAYLLNSNIYKSFKNLSKESFIFNKYAANARRGNSNFYSLNNLYPDNVKKVDGSEFNTLAANEIPPDDAQFYFEGEKEAVAAAAVASAAPLSFASAAAEQVASTMAPNMIYAAKDELVFSEPEISAAAAAAATSESVEIEDNALTTYPVAAPASASSSASSFIIFIKNLFFP
jgi:hypothetical protein